jgi:hypothetical protein
MPDMQRRTLKARDMVSEYPKTVGMRTIVGNDDLITGLTLVGQGPQDGQQGVGPVVSQDNKSDIQGGQS